MEKPVVRNNYFIQTNVGDGPNPMDKEELAWCESIVGPEDEFRHGSHGEDRNNTKETTVEGMSLRTERQTLRRLGISGGVVFTVRTYMTPVVSLDSEEAARLASALQSWPSDVGRYKGKERGKWFGAVITYLLQIVANNE